MVKNILIAFFLFVCSGAFAQTKEDLEKKKNETLKEIEVLNKQYASIKESKKESLGQLNMIQQKINLRNQLIDGINKQVLFINKDIDSSNKEKERMRKDLEQLKKDYAQSVVYAYKNRSTFDFLNFIFSATSFNDAIRRIAYLRSYRDYQERQAEAIEQTQILYTQKIAELKTTKDAKNLVLQDKTKEMGELLKDKEEKDLVVGSLKKREGQINAMLAAKRKQSKEIEAAIKAVVKREIELAKKEAEKKAKEERERKAKEEKDRAAKEAEEKRTGNTTSTTPITNNTNKTETTDNKNQSYLEYNKEDLALGVSFESNKGKLPYPVDNGYIAIGFGPYTVPGTKITGSQDFITFASPVGSSVKAVFDGEVVSIFDVGGMYAVMLKHGKYFTTYSNLSSTSVSKGQNVTPGQIIGKVGENLEGDGQLDFILTKEAQMLNPQQWLRK